MNIFDHLYHPDIDNAFQRDGYVMLKDVLSTDKISGLRKEIDLKIDLCSQQLKCSKEDYLSTVSRWVDPSVVTSVVTPQTLEALTKTAQAFIKRPVHPKKINIICKNAYCREPIAYHQDISYSPQDPYQFSMWMALDDISSESSPLEVIPGSHLLPLKSAVDFWSPRYKPDPLLKLRALKLAIKSGDVIFFDSRLWHGSGENKDLASRYALVTRWASEVWEFDQSIPAIEPDFFGMWTSGKVTEHLLSQGLSILFNKSVSDFEKLIDTWMQLVQEDRLPFVKDVCAALESFKKLRILNLAHTHHNGGDATGTVYKTFWEVFLSSLERYLTEIQRKSA